MPNPPSTTMHRTLFSNGIISLAAIALAAPIMLIAAAWFLGEAPYFSYFIEQGLLTDYSINSTIIAVGSTIMALAIGTLSAWFVTMTDFPFRRALQWALILPLAIPSYIAAIIYGYLLEGAGPVQYALRDWLSLDYGDYPFPPIRSLGGVIFILGITLYPYVYMLARAAFLMQSRHMLETAQLLGLNQYVLFTRLALPLARPALVAGAALVAMEALADFGVVSLYGVPALTTGIMRAWHGLYDPLSAARMAWLLLVIIAACIWLEKRSRAQAKYHNSTALYHPLERWKLSTGKGWMVSLSIALIVNLGALLPLATLLYWSLPNLHIIAAQATLSALASTSIIGLLTGCLTVMIGLIFAYALRTKTSRPLHMLIHAATLGYAVPGSVIAIGVLMLCIAVQGQFFNHAPLLTGSIIAIIWGCSTRFMTVAFHNINTGLERVTTAMDEAALMLGARRLRILSALHIPVIRSSLMIAFLLVFIDTIKELPATLLLRPFDVTTLAIRVYELAKDDMLPHAAPSGLLLVALSLAPVLYLNHKLNAARPGGHA